MSDDLTRIQVEEDYILEMIEELEVKDNEDPSALWDVLDMGNLYRKEGLTPFYIYDPMKGSFVVTSEENMDNRLH